ncbi:MAG TPA: hypothetical protein VHO29_04055 [Marmoricola sp.]|nr:hypothetical protein [Marmoricola sp.]
MSWEITIRRQTRNEPSAHVLAAWNHPSTITDVSMEAGEGVRRSSFGGASRREMAEWSKPLEGVFRWSDDLAEPQVILRWTDEDGSHAQAVTIDD